MSLNMRKSDYYIDPTQINQTDIISNENDVILNNENNQYGINSMLVKLCCVLERLKWETPTFGSFTTAKQQLNTLMVNDNLSHTYDYYITIIPPFRKYDSIKQSDMLIYDQNEAIDYCPSLLLHKMIYDWNSSVKYILHLNSIHIAAVSTMSCGLSIMSRERAILGKISYFPCFSPISMDNMNIKSYADDESRVIFIKNNGAICFGSTIEEAFHYALHLDNACKIQTLSMPDYDNNNNNGDNNDADNQLYESFYKQTKSQRYFQDEFDYYYSLSIENQSEEDEQQQQTLDKMKSCNISMLNNNNNNNNEKICVHNESKNSPNILITTDGSNLSDPFISPQLMNTSLHESLINVPRCESVKEVILSHEFRSNINNSTVSFNSQSEEKNSTRKRTGSRFRKKRCYSLTSGVEKAIARKFCENNSSTETERS